MITPVLEGPTIIVAAGRPPLSDCGERATLAADPVERIITANRKTTPNNPARILITRKYSPVRSSLGEVTIGEIEITMPCSFPDEFRAYQHRTSEF
jgi:hypothetical protein